MKKNPKISEFTKNEIEMIKKLHFFLSESDNFDKQRYFNDIETLLKDFRVVEMIENYRKPTILKKSNKKFEREIFNFSKELRRLQSDEPDIVFEMMTSGSEYLIYRLGLQRALERNKIEKNMRNFEHSSAPKEFEEDSSEQD